MISEQEKEKLFKQFHQAAVPLVYAILRREDDELAWDIATKGILELDSFKGDSDVITWFNTLARHACLYQLRIEKRRGEISLEELPEKDWDTLVVENEAVRKLDLDSLKYLKGERELVEKILEGQPYAEIAWELGVSESTVKQRWKRFLDRVRRERE